MSNLYADADFRRLSGGVDASRDLLLGCSDSKAAAHGAMELLCVDDRVGPASRRRPQARKTPRTARCGTTSSSSHDHRRRHRRAYVCVEREVRPSRLVGNGHQPADLGPRLRLSFWTEWCLRLKRCFSILFRNHGGLISRRCGCEGGSFRGNVTRSQDNANFYNKFAAPPGPGRYHGEVSPHISRHREMTAVADTKK